MKELTEHLWSGIIKRSETGRGRKENMILCETFRDIRRYMDKIIDETHPKKGDTIDLNNLDVSGMEDMSYLFSALKYRYYNFNVSDWDVSNVKNMYSMFYRCENFDCDLSKWDVFNVTNMQRMFEGCYSLKKLPNWYHE